MKLILPSYEIYEQAPGLEGIYEAIERAGRTCYKSKRPEGQIAKDFVDRMIKSGHGAVLEHGTVYLDIPLNIFGGTGKYLYNSYSKVNKIKEGHVYITTNYRVLVENDWLEDLKYLCEPTEHHEKRVTVRFTSNIHFYKDITRHRRMSFAIESTRYCNYNRGKFDNQLTFIIPVWSNIPEWNESEANKIYSDLPKDTYEKQWDAWYNYTFGGLLDKVNYYEAKFLQGLRDVEETYIDLTTDDPKLPGHWQAQQAAEILPQATKADIVMTGFVSDWNYVFDLRARGTTGAPHPEVKRLIEPLMHEFEEKKWIK